jgi:hypothetical protein
MTRDEAIEYLKKIPADEPVFVLRGQDQAAPHAVLAWAKSADLMGAPSEKVKEAHDKGMDMAHWQYENPNRVKVPD